MLAYYRFLLFAVLWAPALPAAAQPVVLPADSGLTLPELTITATRNRISVADAPVQVTILNARAIAETGATNTAELLAARSGGFVRRYGSGGLATVSLRGTSPSQTLILLDGHRIADPQLGQLDLSLLPAFLLESVEIMQGPGAALYGSDGIGGVVNLQTMQPSSASMVRIGGGYGAFGERLGELALSMKQGRLSGLMALDYEHQEGDFSYMNNVLFPPREVRRNGADRSRVSLYTTLHLEGPRSDTRWGGWFNNAERGLPGPGTQRPLGERQWDQHLRLWTHHEHRFDRGSFHLGGLIQRGSLRYVNPRLNLDETGHSWIGSLDAEVRTTRGDNVFLAGGLTTGYGRAEHPNLSADASEFNLGTFLNSTVDLGRVQLYPALRFDMFDMADAASTSLSPRLALNLRPFAYDLFRLKTSLSRSFRIPTFNDRFWQPGGNPNLEPERGWTYDAGVFFKHHHQELELTAYTASIRDQIVWQPEGSIWSPVNVGRVRSRGVEASYTIRTTQWNTGMIYTLTEAVDRSDPDSPTFDRQLRYVPRYQLKAFLGTGWRGLNLDVSGRYVGTRFITADGHQSLDPYVVLDARLRYCLTTRMATATLSLALENLLNRAYTVIKDYPMPPRHLRVRLVLQTL